MKALFKLLLGGVLLFWSVTLLLPSPSPESAKIEPQPEQVTLAEVSQKSSDALTTTATFMKQEKARIDAHMSITLRKLDRVIEDLQGTLADASDSEKPVYQRRLENWQSARENVVQLQSRLEPAENSTLDQIKENWRAVQVQISGNLLD